jgi:hypothetical protein
MEIGKYQKRVILELREMFYQQNCDECFYKENRFYRSERSKKRAACRFRDSMQ